ncbi:hypothetical protein BGX27_009631 [Mortierella sp. AM989]|nr:hypothetical protein BGX27_009631 [Mortierella sp. AM989]
MSQPVDNISSIDEPLITETTALLKDSFPESTKDNENRATAWYWPWQPSYWAAVIAVFLMALSGGPVGALTSIFLKELICERGIPTLFPVPSNQSSEAYSGRDDDKCNSAEYSAALAKFISIASVLSSVTVTLTVRYWSALSDRIGRKRIMLINNVGSITTLALAVFVRTHKDANLYLLYVGVVVDGLIGSVALVDILLHAYASDLTLPEERTLVFGRLIAGNYAGLAIGTALGGMAAEKYGLDFVYFWMAPCLSLTCFVYILLIPESLTSAAISKNRDKQIQSTVIEVESSHDAHSSKESEQTSLKQHIKSFFKGFTPETLPNTLAGKHGILKLMLAFTLIMGAVGVVNIMVPMYLLYRFRWTEGKLSYFVSIAGISQLLSMTFFLPYVKKFAPHSALADSVASIGYDLKLVVAGLFIVSMTFFIYGVSPVGEGFYIGCAFGSLGTMFAPATRGILTQSVAPELVGEMLGTVATLGLLVSMVAPLVAATHEYGNMNQQM